MAVVVKIKGFKMKKMRFIRSGLIAVLGLFVIVSTIYAAPVQYIKDTKHNLSNWAPVGNPIRAVGTTLRDTEVCIFCHAPHNADSTQAPLWSHVDQDASVTFQMASTANVSPNRGTWADATPTGISKKCLSCHDGTVAIGALAIGATITVTGASGGTGDKLTGSRGAGGGLVPDGEGKMDYGFIGTDLRGGHVISFNYEAFQETIDSVGNDYKKWDTEITTADKNLMFDRQGRMQCHTCHDPHNDWCDENPGGPGMVGNDPLWRKACDPDPAIGNASVCRVCHKNMVAPFQRYSF